MSVNCHRRVIGHHRAVVGSLLVHAKDGKVPAEFQADSYILTAQIEFLVGTGHLLGRAAGASSAGSRDVPSARRAPACAVQQVADQITRINLLTSRALHIP